jgi:hypothetical protein
MDGAGVMADCLVARWLTGLLFGCLAGWLIGYQ